MAGKKQEEVANFNQNMFFFVLGKEAGFSQASPSLQVARDYIIFYGEW